MTHIFLDTEFNPYTHQVLVFCAMTDEGDKYEIDCRTESGREELRVFVDHFRDATWCAYSTLAEMESILLCGATLQGMKWLDLMTESAMITGTYEDLYLPRASLLKHLERFQIPHASKDFKRDMIDLILSKDDFTAEEFSDIAEYCWTDVYPLKSLYEHIVAFHECERTVWIEEHATVMRGEYLKASAILAHRSKGFPVDEAWIKQIFKNRQPIRMSLAQRANAEYGFPIYQYNHVRDDYSFSYSGLEAYLATQPWGLQWERTPSGRLKTDHTYVDDLIKKFPTARMLGWVKDSLAQLKNDNLAKLVEHDEFGDAYVRPTSIPYWTVTGRNQPMVRGGFILNMPPWLRTTIRPHAGRCLVGADWGKQEIAIGCALSGDTELLRAYLTGDIYLTLGKMAGAIPPEGTKDTHPVQRQTYKSVQLGLGYGMGKPSLARQIYNDINAGSDVLVHDMAWCQEQADVIYDWHKATFSVYWEFLDREAKRAKREGYNISKDGWLYFANKNTKHTRLINFPSQANGAMMLREAMCELAYDTGLNVVCSLHDAIYIECAVEDVEEHKAILKACMERAAEKVVGDIPITVDFKVYTHESGYHDGRGTETLKLIRSIIEEIETNGTPTAPPKPLRKRRVK